MRGISANVCLIAPRYSQCAITPPTDRGFHCADTSIHKLSLEAGSLKLEALFDTRRADSYRSPFTNETLNQL